MKNLDDFYRNDLRDLIIKGEIVTGQFSTDENFLNTLVEEASHKKDFGEATRNTTIGDVWESLNTTQKQRMHEIYNDVYQENPESPPASAVEPQPQPQPQPEPQPEPQPQPSKKKKKKKKKDVQDGDDYLDILQSMATKIYNLTQARDHAALRGLLQQLQETHRQHIQTIIDTRFDYGLNALDEACLSDDYQTAELLIDNGADYKASALLSACRYKGDDDAEESHRCFQMLFERLSREEKANSFRKMINATDAVYRTSRDTNRGATLLTSAIEYRDTTHVARILLEAQADVMKEDEDGLMAHHYASQNRRTNSSFSF